MQCLCPHTSPKCEEGAWARSDLCLPPVAGPVEQPLPTAVSPSACIVEYGKALDISYLQYLWEAHTNILHCMRDCRVWSALYDGDSPDPETFLQSLTDESAGPSTFPVFGLPPPLPRKTGPQLAPRKDKNQTELEWDDSYDTGISSGADVGSPRPYDELENSGPPVPMEPPKHIQEMKKNAILLFKGSYIEESDFQDDVMVYRLCAEKDSEDAKSQADAARPADQGQPEVQGPPTNNGPLPSPQPEMDSEEEPNRDNSDLVQNTSKETEQENEPEVAPESNSELAPRVSEAEHSSDPTLVSPEGDDFIAQYDQIIQELDSGTKGFVKHNYSSPDPLLLTEEQEGKEEESKGEEEAEEEEEGKKELEEEEDDFDSFIVEAPAAEILPSPFGARDETASACHHPVRTQSAPFTGDRLSLLCDCCF